VKDAPPSLLVYSALGTPPFRSVKLRKRRATCPACGTESQKVGSIEDIDYVQFCGGDRPDWESLGLQPGTAESRITANVGTPAGQPLFKNSGADG
jgi:adenylyltransferase/sulfurtransferase